MARGMAPFIKALRLFMRSPTKGAETSVFLASSPQANGISGRYFADRKEKRSHESSYDAALTARLWQVSSDLVGLPAAPA
jgi:hypothetical protein